MESCKAVHAFSIVQVLTQRSADASLCDSATFGSGEQSTELPSLTVTIDVVTTVHVGLYAGGMDSNWRFFLDRTAHDTALTSYLCI